METVQNSTPKLYRIDILIEDKHSKGIPKSVIYKELQSLLKVGYDQLSRIRRAKANETGFLNTQQLICLASYFEVSIDDLVNQPAKSLPTPECNPES